ncbi:epimerase [Roseovarius atlanticus]|uniref:Epimerase n=1 Tax=Roseovarius atlanticus TaxID=1641875 RepID=A0A0T5NSJ8_9RHOB|nr:NAD-dependent epimerase/dehydratase family protein [Roseovarius atlanticus]KRS11895.1 epimerase [Roseovarius atlanticus]
MGDVTRILITGASGFIGQASVRAARARGLEVFAIYRSTLPPDWADDAGITPLRIDLSDDTAGAALVDALDHVDAVIHAAAHLGGDADAHDRDTVAATQTLLAVLSDKPLRLVHVSSIAVYDPMTLADGDTVTEETAQDNPETARDAYTAGKLRQEELIIAAGQPTWLMRPGAVYGPGRTFHPLLGFWVSKLFVCIDGGGELPHTHVDHTAEALVAAACTDPGGVRALNVLDDDRPTRIRFVRTHRRIAGWPHLVLPLPYRFWLMTARLLRPLAPRLPGLLQEPILRARLMPLQWPNTALRSALGGKDQTDFAGMLQASISKAES